MTDRVQLFIDGAWSDGHGGEALPFWNPASGEEIGMVAVAERHGPALPETPFGGVKDSGYGSEGGAESLDPCLVTRFVTHAA